MNNKTKVLLLAAFVTIAGSVFYFGAYRPVQIIHAEKLKKIGNIADDRTVSGKSGNAAHRPVNGRIQKEGSSKMIRPENQGATRSLSISGCPYPIQIVEAQAYAFPEDLSTYGMKLTRTVNGYLLDTLGQDTVIHGSSRDSDGDDHLVTLPQATDRRTLRIEVPRGSDLGVNSDGTLNLNVTVPIGIFTADLNGNSDMSLLSVSQIAKIETGAGSNSKVVVGDAGIVNVLELGGSNVVRFVKAQSIASLESNGSSIITIPPSTQITSQDLTGSSKILRQ